MEVGARRERKRKHMKWPNELNLCKECKRHSCPTWFLNKIEEWVDMDYSYSSFRPSLLVCARKTLCPDCAKKVIECADRMNNWGEQTDESASCVTNKGCTLSSCVTNKGHTLSSIDQTANFIDISARRERIIGDA